MLRYLFCFFLLASIGFKAFSQEAITKKSEVKINKAYIKSYLYDTRDILISPLKINTKQFLAISAIGATAGSLMLFADKPVKDFAQKNRSIAGDNLFRWGAEHWGDGLYTMPTMAAFYLCGKISHNERAVKTAMLGVKTFIITAAIIDVPKELFHRQRPYVAGDPRVFHGPFSGYGNDKNRSFPSGHSMSAFAMATIISSEYKEYKIVPVIAYSIASLTAMSRVYFDKHWSSDILIGSAFGYAMAKIIYNRNNWNVNISPIYSHSTKGIYIKIPLK